MAFGLRLPEAEESTTYHQPALKVRGRTFAWLSPHEEGALVLRCEPEERQLMLESQPEVFWTTPHYAGHPMVLVHLDAIGPDELEERVAESWVLTAPPRLASTLARG